MPAGDATSPTASRTAQHPTDSSKRIDEVSRISTRCLPQSRTDRPQTSLGKTLLVSSFLTAELSFQLPVTVCLDNPGPFPPQIISACLTHCTRSPHAICRLKATCLPTPQGCPGIPPCRGRDWRLACRQHKVVPHRPLLVHARQHSSSSITSALRITADGAVLRGLSCHCHRLLTIRYASVNKPAASPSVISSSAMLHPSPLCLRSSASGPPYAARNTWADSGVRLNGPCTHFHSRDVRIQAEHDLRAGHLGNLPRDPPVKLSLALEYVSGLPALKGVFGRPLPHDTSLMRLCPGAISSRQPAIYMTREYGSKPHQPSHAALAGNLTSPQPHSSQVIIL